MGYQILEPRFQLGRTYTSLGVAHLRVNVLRYYKRHQCGDWGDVTEEQKNANEDALISGGSLLSQFEIETPDGKKHAAYVLTEENRGRTVVMLTTEFQP
jgi:hypothetical protein